LAMYILDQYRGTSVSCRYTVPPSLTSPEAYSKLKLAVETAVVDVVLKHPILQVGIANADSKKPKWVQLNNLNLRHHITWRILDTSVDFDSKSQEITMSEVDGLFLELESRPGWRIVVVHQESADFLDIHFTWNHPHADGISAKIFQEDLFHSLNNQKREDHKIQEGSDSLTILLPKDSPRLPPSIEDVCKLPLGLGFTMKMVWEELGPAPLAWTRLSLARWAPFQLSPYKTQFRAFTVKEDALTKILLSCRKHKTTLTGLLHGLTLASLASHLTEEAASAFESGTT